jgi:hypothetical protein
MLHENVFQNPELFPTQVSLSPEHSTLVPNKILTHDRCPGLAGPVILATGKSTFEDGLRSGGSGSDLK